MQRKRRAVKKPDWEGGLGKGSGTPRSVCFSFRGERAGGENRSFSAIGQRKRGKKPGRLTANGEKHDKNGYDPGKQYH